VSDATPGAPTPQPAAANRQGALFLFADMSLMVLVTATVKVLGGTLPAIQIVFLRAVVGLLVVLPLVWRYRAEVFDTRRLRDHLGRVLCNGLSLSCTYVAVTALPLAVVTAVSFTRPLVTLGFAAVLLAERAPAIRWAASLVCFGGVLLMTNPGAVPWDMGLAAACGAVLFGSLSVIQTRRLRGENMVLMMLLYTFGLTLLTAVPAAVLWVTPRLADVPALVLIGLLSQVAQVCFLRAHNLAEIRVLAPLGYLAIVLSMTMDYAAFGLVPAPVALLGAAIIMVSAFGAQVLDRTRAP
jgi:S-adenosylmethionine uptake transporter